MSREAMQIALDALEANLGNWAAKTKAVEVLRQALETEQEPVAWMHNFIAGNVITHIPADIGRHPERWTPLYTAPPRKQWVGLTDEEIDALSQARSLTDELMDCVDRLGSEADTVDPRVWQHLLVYAPKPEEEPMTQPAQQQEPVGDDRVMTVVYRNVQKEDAQSFTDHPKAVWFGWCHAPYERDDARFKLEKAITSPPASKPWVGLTDEEVGTLTVFDGLHHVETPLLADFIRAIEAKLKDKNV